MSKRTGLPIKSSKHRPRRLDRSPLLAILILLLTSLACVHSEIVLTVKRGGEGTDTVDVRFQHILTDKYLEVAKSVNQERADDYAAAGFDAEGNLLPEKISEFEGIMIDDEKFRNEGYDVTVTDKEYIATKTVPLVKDQSTEKWQVKVTQNEEHPEQITYQTKVMIDLTMWEGIDIFELRDTELPEKPKLEPGSNFDPQFSWSLLYDSITNTVGAMGSEVKNEIEMELWYGQKALIQSDEMEYRVIVELPGKIHTHQLNGKDMGNLEGNRVSLVLDEEALRANAGKTLTFKVASLYLDCNRACTGSEHLMWDGKGDGTSCNCICESGWKSVEVGEEIKCTHCDEWCAQHNEDLERDEEKCEPDECACKCKSPLVMNRAGTKCITESESWLEDQESSQEGLPSPQALGEIVLTFLELLEEGGEDYSRIKQMPGWCALTPDERERFLTFMEELGVVVEDHKQLTEYSDGMTTDERLRLIKERENKIRRVRALAIHEREMDLIEKARIQKWIIYEIEGKAHLGSHLTKLQHLLKWDGSIPLLARQVVDEELKSATKKKIINKLMGPEPKTVQEAAAFLVSKLPELATGPCVDDFYLYKKFFDEHCKSMETCSDNEIEIAHEIALQKLRESLGTEVTNMRGSGRINWAKEGGPYDRAFWGLIGMPSGEK